MNDLPEEAAMTDHLPSKEQIQPCPHGHTPGLCRLCMQAEIERLKQQREDWMRRWTDLQLAQESTQSIAASTLVCDLVAQNKRLQRQVDELSVHAEKWVKRALKPAHEREMPHCSTCSCGMAPDAAEAMLEAGRQVYGGGWIDHGPDCTEDGCKCGLEDWIRRYHTLLNLDISHWPAQPPGDDPADVIMSRGDGG